MDIKDVQLLAEHALVRAIMLEKITMQGYDHEAYCRAMCDAATGMRKVFPEMIISTSEMYVNAGQILDGKYFTDPRGRR